MGYKSQPQDEQEVAKSPDDLAVFREQLAVLQAKIASAKTEESDLRESILVLEAAGHSANQALADLEVRKAHLSSEIDVAIRNALSAKEAELENKLALQITEPAKALAKKAEELDKQAKTLIAKSAALVAKEDLLALRESVLLDRELALSSNESFMEKAREQLVSEIKAFENSKDLFAAEVSAFKADQAALTAKKEELDKTAKTLSGLEAALIASTESMKLKLDSLDDVAKREEKLAVDLKEFEAAKLAVESKEQELDIFERDLKKRLAEVKQQQQALAIQLKGEQP